MKWLGLACLLILVLGRGVATAANERSCGALLTTSCGVQGDAKEGDFHGLIMVPVRPGVLETAAHSGTQSGCGDCTWTLIIACVFDGPDTAEQTPCARAGRAPQCDPGQTLYRLYLTTDAVTNLLVDTLCLG